jgi:hypothetical protein
MIKFFLLSVPIFAVIGVGWAATRTRLVSQGALDALTEPSESAERRSVFCRGALLVPVLYAIVVLDLGLVRWEARQP